MLVKVGMFKNKIKIRLMKASVKIFNMNRTEYEIKLKKSLEAIEKKYKALLLAKKKCVRIMTDQEHIKESKRKAEAGKREVEKRKARRISEEMLMKAEAARMKAEAAERRNTEAANRRKAEEEERRKVEEEERRKAEEAARKAEANILEAERRKAEANRLEAARRRAVAAMNSAQVRVMARRIWNTTIALQPLNKQRIAYRKWMLKGHPNKGGNEWC